ncbi:SDR family NAD(P)-dependent oxidoreductase [Shinella zoogloeoides]|uniref:SDR family NAD(P)-dependent oxidoreductase n=1 Tax=Shinella zoogloeoides TaxID=352475 RepID=UPI00299D9F5A|nr:SDR family NAD(P)-dependent oxidoreductase [Shinella zoogloeoides]WPE19143.1 3-oxoacyl-[acyl-carrier-protein] reductase FabG [Shinella zoogloeoides]
MTPADLTGRVALITGASRGIGLAAARRLADQGASVVLVARQIGEPVLDMFDPERLLLIEGDVGVADFSQAAVKQVFSRYRRLDILVNNAGIMRPAMTGMISDADIHESLQTNVAGVVHFTQAAARLMARTGGSIVNLSSIVGVRGVAGQLVYAASKAGVIGATLAAAKELARHNIRVNAVAPGFIETALTEGLSPEIKAETLRSIGLARPGTAEEVADVILFLASDLSRYVTGQVIGVDGGMVI